MASSASDADLELAVDTLRGAVFDRLLVASSRPTTLAERLASQVLRPRRIAHREHDTIAIAGHGLERTKKYRDVERTGRAGPSSLDDIASLDPWHVRGVDIRGRAEALDGSRPLIRIHPERIVPWGIGDSVVGRRHARTVTRLHG